MTSKKSALVRACATALTLATAVALAACSSDDDSKDSGSSSASSTATDSFPVSVDTKFGEVSIDKQPTTVVALGWGDAEIATELGVQPVGVSDWLSFGGNGLSPWAKASYEKAPEQLGTMEIDYEKVAALKPDLILNVRSAGDENAYKKLSAIAPTVSPNEGGDNWLTPWDTQVEMISTALGEKKKGTDLVTQVNDKLSEVKDAHPQWADKSATVLAKTAAEWGAYVKGDARADLLASLGFKQNETIAGLAKDSFYVSLSEENVDQANSDVVVGFPIMVPVDSLSGDSAWKKLSAVKDGHAIVADEELSNAISLGTPASLLHAVELLTLKLEDATK